MIQKTVTVVTTAGPLAATAENGRLVPYTSVSDDEIKAELTTQMTLRQPRVLKRFNSLNDITFSDSGATSTRIIDPNGPWDRPALKLTIVDGGAQGRTDVIFTNVNIPEFDDHIAYRVWVDNYTRVSQFTLFIGNDASYTKVYQNNHLVFTSNEQLFSGPRTLVIGPQSAGAIAASPTFVFGTDTLAATKIRITTQPGQTAVVWIDAIEIPQRQRPIVCLNFDDADDSIADSALPILEATGIRATFGVNTADIDASNKLTSAEVQAISIAGHQVAAHNQNNNKLLTLYSAGRIAGNGTPQELSGYLTEYRNACAALEALGIPQEDFCYHPWVQGGFDGSAMEEFQAAGVRIARGIVDQSGSGKDGYGSACVYGSGLANRSMCLPWFAGGNAYTLAQALQGLADTVKYGSAFIPSFHVLASTASDSITWAESDFRSLCEQIAAYKDRDEIDVLTMREFADRLRVLGLLEDAVYGYRSKDFVRQIGHLSSANFNSTADQAITLPTGQSWVVTDIIATNVTVNLTTAAGGVYSAASKAGTDLVANTQVYTALTGTATQILRLTIANSPTVTTPIYFSLTTGQGSAATGDLFVFGRPV